LPSAGDTPRARCHACGAVFHLPKLAEGEELPHPDAFPGYRVVAIVGFGGMGTVYRAIQLSMEREVALKVLHKRYSHVPRFVDRFEREATALAALNHPNIVAVIDRGRVGDTYYFVMEYVRGRTLRYLMRNKQLTVERAVEVAVQICDALHAAHACGVVHRDIKPGNILVAPDGLVKVADFGIVHIAGDDKHAERERRTRLGTAKYMAPEQRGTGLVVDHRADIYALGTTLYEMLTGRLPDGSPASAHNPAIPKPLDEIIERATREDREERFQSAVEMRDALEAILATLKLEETSATAVLAPPEGATCPACGAALGAADLHCPTCRNRVREPCFRPGCGALNPVGAERCSLCSGHLKLMEGERRAHLEAALDKAKRLMAEGRLAEARAELEPVQGSASSPQSWARASWPPRQSRSRPRCIGSSGGPRRRKPSTENPRKPRPLLGLLHRTRPCSRSKSASPPATRSSSTSWPPRGRDGPPWSRRLGWPSPAMWRSCSGDRRRPKG